MTWSDAWQTLNSEGTLEERPQQRALAEAVFSVTDIGGTLVGEAGTGVGKSYAYLIPLIYQAKNGERGVVSTETTALQDQLVDKDLPLLKEKFGAFKFRSLKGRSHYLCLNRAPREHGTVLRLRTKDPGDGERRDLERVLGYRISDDEWELLSGDADFCAQNKCAPEKCYSSRARQLALEADIVVCNHALLRTHAEMEDGLLGDFEHLVVDEAHTLEKVLIDGWGDEMTPYERYQRRKSIRDGIDTAMLYDLEPTLQEAERLMLEALESATSLFTKLSKPKNDFEWRRQNFALAEVYLSGPQDGSIVAALDEYEHSGPIRLKEASRLFKKLGDQLSDQAETMGRGTRKVRKGATAAHRLYKMCDILAKSLQTRDGIVMMYGVPHVVIADGWKAWKGNYDVRVRIVPLDVSERAREDLWKDPKSVTLVSATLSDGAAADFGYTLASLGLSSAEPLTTLTVNSPFDYARQQLLYLTPEKDTQVDVPGAQFSLDEMLKVLDASDGRGLVLFTARSELDFAAEELLRRSHSHRVLVQEQNANKQVLVEEFKRDKSSVLLATRSFFVGVDFPGETCSVVILAKYPLPQFNTLCRAQIAWWRGRGFTNWYEREGALVARQAVGRLIRTETDHGIIALLDQRPGMHEKIVNACAGSYVTRDVEDVRRWLND